ncbi:hypothetical protein LZD49_34525 [Dyadobacter sp. CY261]|uniref:hypothetical protein n=1 Tax=Dyadobacter sp. CY261 TaxID=2907203 RepID=UPI001F29EC66|nr:hypothetical protein [Dyadobacter sp. CY261]MCF0075639.1 hypothetical protein [Dyadobacter sp. CY261]
MKTKSKLSVLPLAALLLGGSLALAANFPGKQAQRWTRTGGSTSENWQQGQVSGCVTTSGICQADFPENYDPNEHSAEDNQSAATVVSNGYVP